MIIREAKFTDIDEIKILIESFHLEAKLQLEGLNLNLDNFEILLAQLMKLPEALILVCEKDKKIVGTVAGVIAPWIGDTSQKILQEIWWYVDSKERGVGGELLKTFEKIGKQKDIDFVLMVTLDSQHEDKLIRYYTKQGYQHLEHHFIKRIV